MNSIETLRTELVLVNTAQRKIEKEFSEWKEKLSREEDEKVVKNTEIKELEWQHFIVLQDLRKILEKEENFLKKLIKERTS